MRIKKVRQHLLIALLLLTLGIFDGSLSYVFQKYLYTNTNDTLDRVFDNWFNSNDFLYS